MLFVSVLSMCLMCYGVCELYERHERAANTLGADQSESCEGPEHRVYVVGGVWTVAGLWTSWRGCCRRCRGPRPRLVAAPSSGPVCTVPSLLDVAGDISPGPFVSPVIPWRGLYSVLSSSRLSRYVLIKEIVFSDDQRTFFTLKIYPIILDYSYFNILKEFWDMNLKCRMILTDSPKGSIDQ